MIFHPKNSPQPADSFGWFHPEFITFGLIFNELLTYRKLCKLDEVSVSLESISIKINGTKNATLRLDEFFEIGISGLRVFSAFPLND